MEVPLQPFKFHRSAMNIFSRTNHMYLKATSGVFLPIPMPHSCIEMNKLLSLSVMGPQAGNYLEMKLPQSFLRVHLPKAIRYLYSVSPISALFLSQWGGLCYLSLLQMP